MFRRQCDPWLRLTAGAVLAQHCVSLFFLPFRRYYYLTWLLTLLVVAVWLHDEGIALVKRRWPALAQASAKIARHPACMAIERGLDRMIADWDGSDANARRPAT